jgi:anti-anti-sigma factor
VGSIGLRALIEALNRNRSKGGDLKLAALNPRVLRVLRTIGFTRLLPTYGTTEAALAEFGGAASPAGELAPCPGA